MYSTCLFCNTSLGRNDQLEIFPVGSRLSFDARLGRLWVVCRSCERWNLSPLEERWEAIEWCEQRFSCARLRVTTENIGLARLGGGLELVRIGTAQRPELAAWRYGDQFGRRRRRQFVRAGAGIGLLSVALGGGIGAGASVVIFYAGVNRLVQRIVHGDPNDVIARIPCEADRIISVRRNQLDQVRLVADGSSGWQLAVPGVRSSIVLSGERAEWAAAVLFPAFNRYGGSKKDVTRAVAELEHHGSAAGFLAAAAQQAGVRDPVPVIKRSAAIRLALEMAVHEDAERRALDGELAALEAAWRDAEDLASIADNLLYPGSVEQSMARLRDTAAPPPAD